MRKIINLIGKKFGKLTPIKYMGRSQWLCKCDCGEKIVVRSDSLKDGNTKSCGCLYKEKMSKGLNFKHGHSKIGKISKIYSVWQSMNYRCNKIGFKYYNEKKIKVCWRWSNKNPKGFQNFYKDVGDPPKGKSLDRTNNDKGYYPNNWRWATRKEQQRNRNSNHIIPYNHKKYVLIGLAEKYKIRPETLWSRLYLYKWPIKKALTTPIRKQRRKK